MWYDIQGQLPTQVFASEAGFVCIRQQSVTGETLVVMDPGRIQELAAALQLCVNAAVEKRKAWINRPENMGGRDA